VHRREGERLEDEEVEGSSQGVCLGPRRHDGAPWLASLADYRNLTAEFL
jgi:hypothetical protein